MKRIFLFILTSLFVGQLAAQIDLSKKIPGIDYDSQYRFKKAVEMSFDFYNKRGDHEMTIPYTTYYKDDFKVFSVKHQRRNTVYQTLFDMPKNNILVILGEGDQIMGSASVMQDRSKKERTTLPLSKSNEKKKIAGVECLKYNFTGDKIYGELWVAPSIKDLPNEVGVLKASKMGIYYQDVPVDGFVMEITSYTDKGKKTIMTTTALRKSVDYEINIPENFGAAINKVDYYKY